MMTPERWKIIGDLCEEVLALAPDRRSAFLDEACRHDPDLRREVETLIGAADRRPAFMEQPALDDLGVPLTSATPEGRYIGPYRIVRTLGRGGMGEVYLAVREVGSLTRHVALKVIRRGMDTEDILRRFEAERYILGNLNHPNIARLLDAGQTEQGNDGSGGQPYYVMEYVDGVPITTYCDAHTLSVDERLRLFQKVCEAVQYAHQNLVVHRDLKPSNLLVTESGMVKLLDFGIAKVLSPWQPGLSMLETHTGRRVMTPAYASPEQVRGDAVTTASDVYSLGILLYELLTGVRPYSLKDKSEGEVIRIICAAPPTRPSIVVTRGPQPGTTPTAVTDARRMNLDRLHRRLKGDLDTIVLMALRKEPARRYRTALELAEDIERHLAGMPVRARKDTLGYRMQKFIGRNRVGVSTAAVVLLLVLGFGIAMIVQSRQVAQERDRSRLEAERADQILQVLVGVFESSNPEVMPGSDTLGVGAFLEQGEDQMLEALDGHPEAQGRLKQVLGSMYMARSQFDRARTLLEAAAEQQRGLGPDHPEAVRTFHQLALLTQKTEDREKARPLLRESLARHRRAYGEEHLAVARAMQDLAAVLPTLEAPEEKDHLLTGALQIRRKLLGERHPDVAETLHLLGIHRQRMGNREEGTQRILEAIQMFTELLGERHPQTLRAMQSHLNVMEDADEQVKLARYLLGLRREIYGDESVEVATNLNDLAIHLVVGQNNFEEGIPVFREALGLWKKLVGTCHWNVANTARNFAITLDWAGHDEASRQTFQEAVDVVRCARGPEGHQTGYLMVQQSEILLKLGRHDEALRQAQAGVAIIRNIVPEDGDYTLVEGLTNLGAIHLEMGAVERAEALFREALSLRQRWFGHGTDQGAATKHYLGRALVTQKRYEEAEPFLRESYAVIKDTPPRGKNLPEHTRRLLIETYTALGRSVPDTLMR